MYGQRRHLWQAALFLTILPFLVPIAQAQQPAPDAGITIQASGPIHEAYAEPTDGTAQPGLVVPRQPPDPIPEEPPDQKPEGDNVVWIPGYWAWDAVKNDFLWVSGFWRIPPPGQRWVPGYWTQVDNGWQWVPGFWTAADQQEVPYLPPPPADVDNGPSVPAPNADTIYVPGCWVYRAARYLWRPGFWLNCRPGWIWSRAHYCWSPRGHVFVDGYWDRALEDRGLLFAPVSFSTPLWNTPGWVYRPSCAVNVDNLLGSLFVRPAYSHYYFGDYYGAAYDRLGFQPWFTHGPRVHDPLFGY